MSEWQPIKTAPNREMVLAFSKKHGIVLARRGGDVWSRDLGFAVEDSDGGFYLETASGAGLTHWMPLPPKPIK